ncbi:helix-turn-helix domain-containing protein [Paenibacillus elgii]|uniref:helix-turn-helix domain-containing protein n=1 Tax=Paenibacillus elgii TaxID=189691 RepID=UPI000248CF96|nr:helix-turn-helix domain-containing protein [Paenibacillus elgii]
MRRKGIRFNKHSVIVTWLISYISVLLVPIMISAILYAATWHVVESEINRANESMLRQMEQAIDGNLAGIERLSLEIALNRRVAGFINAQQPLTDSDYYDLVSIAGDLRVYQVANDFIEQIYIYYKNSDTVLSARDHIDSRTLYGRLREKDGTSYEEWKAFFDKRYIREYVPVTMRGDGEPVKAVMYAKSITLDHTDQPGAVIVFVIKDSKLLDNIAPANQASIAVVDKQNRLVASTGFDHNPAAPVYDRLTNKHGLLYETISGKEVAVSYTTSDSTGWKYVSMIPAELFDDKMKTMKLLIYSSIGLSLVIGGIVTFLSLRKNYNPISVLIRSLSVKSGISFDEGSNEYGYLEEALNTTFAEKEKIDQRLRRHRDAIRSHLFQSLLKGRLEQNVPVHESFAAHDIRLASPYFAVLLFHIDHYGKLDSSGYPDPRMDRLLHFIIMNVVEEVAGSVHHAFTTEMDDMLACIVNFGAEPDEEELRRIAAQVKSFLLDHFHIRLTAAISGIHQELYGIPHAYQETLEALEYRLVMGSGEIIRYGDLPGSDTARPAGSYYYPLHVEQQLINFVKTGDHEKASAMIDEIIGMNVSGAGGKRDFLERVNPVDRLTGCETIMEMQVQLREVLGEVCRLIQEERSQEQSNLLSQQVLSFIKDRYNDENLNISMLGEAFGLTPSYLSKQFKTQTGKALLDVISMTRLEEAKRLLPDAKLSVSEIARKVGYADINTFNRIFKKFEGITPGKYREL